MSELLLITVTGEDKPGITAAIAGLLGDHGVDILDIGQSVIHSHLSLGILVNVPDAAEPVYKGLLFASQNLGVGLKFSPIDRESYNNWVGLQGRSRFILTLLARRIRARHIAEVSGIIAKSGLNIDKITRLSGRVPVMEEDSGLSKACVEFSLRGTPDEHFRERLLSVCIEMDIDVAVQEDDIHRRNRRLIAFDMDSTLITTEVIDELAKEAGVADEVTRLTALAMAGELDFQQSLEQRVSLLKGLPESALASVAKRLPLTEGVEHLFATLASLGYKTAIISGGFDYFGQALSANLSVDHLYANKLEIADGKLTGRVLPPIIDAQRKADALREIAGKEGISLAQTIAVGDGANDLAMLDAAGLGIAFHAKPLVRESASHAISNLGLDSLLYLMGIGDSDTI